jgi:hypothetical protein
VWRLGVVLFGIKGMRAWAVSCELLVGEDYEGV